MVLSVTSGLVLRLESDSGIVERHDTHQDHGIVDNWIDLSSSGNDLTSTGDPRVGVVTTPEGQSSISFDGTGDSLERIAALAGLPAGNADRTVFFVVNYVDPQGVYSGISYGDGAGNQTFGLVAKSDGDLTVQGWGAGNDFDSNVASATGGFIVQSAVLEANVVEQFLNGTLIDTNTHVFNTNVQKLVLGAEIAGLGESSLNISAVLIYDRALTDIERQQVDDYLQVKYIDNGVDDPPVAVNDDALVANGDSTAIDILANDADDTGIDPASVSIVSGPANGTITAIDPLTGVVSYTHDGSGLADSFTYTVADTGGQVSAPATVNLDIGVPTGPFSLTGFSDELVLQRADLTGGSPFFLPISMTFLPDNRMLLLSKDGEIRIVDPNTGNSEIYMTLSNIITDDEQGLLDITLDPDFANNGYFYLYYTPNSPENARIARFTHDESSGGLTSSGDLSSESVIWQNTDGYFACCHFGGGLDFGPDGKIWLTTGDAFTASAPGESLNGAPLIGTDLAVDLTSSYGKVIRVNSDGTIPDGTDGSPANPFIDGAGGNDDSIWAYGLRNPFRARWDADYGNLYIGEVGGNQQNLAQEDLHLASLDQPGVFYGWPYYEGTVDFLVNDQPERTTFPLPDGDLGDPANGDFYSSPIFSYPHTGSSASLTGGEVYRGGQFPTEWDGVYFYGDFTRDFIRYVVLDETGTVPLGDFAFEPSAQLPNSTDGVVSINVGEDGALYYAMINTGDVRRVVHDSRNLAPQIVTATLSPTSSPTSNLTVNFDATVSDFEGDPLTYALNLGDGTVLTGNVAGGQISLMHTFSGAAQYDVSLSVSDGNSIAFSQAFSVQLGSGNNAPTIDSFGADVSLIAAGDTVAFSALVSDLDGDTLQYTWNFGDGNSASGTAGPGGEANATYTYTVEGSFDAFLEVTDGIATTLSPTVPIQVGGSSQIPVTAGLALLLESDAQISLGTGNTVSGWLDGSGNGNNLIAQGDPQLVNSATPTGQAAIVFDGVGDLLERVNATNPLNGLPTGASDRTMFFVANYVNHEGVSAGAVYGDGARNQAFGLVSDWNGGDLAVQGWGNANDFDSGVDAASAGWIVQSVVLDANAFNQYLDGSLIDSGTHAFATDVQRLILGGEIKDLGESSLEIGAVLIYNRALTEGERQQVEAFLQAKYITGSGGGNNPPVAFDDAFMFAEDTTLSGVNVLADNGNGVDSDPDGDTLSVSLVSDVTNGALTLNPDGSFSYTPNADFFGPDSFTYRASDGNGGTSDAVVTLTVTPVDDPARATDDGYNTTVDTTLTVVAALGVLANDVDPEGDPFTASLLTDVSNGSLNLAADGSFTYTPNTGFASQDSFIYQVTGGDTATVTIDVSGSAQGALITAGLVAAFESDQNVNLGAGNTVTGWLDGSGQGNDLVAAGDPTLVAGATPTGEAAIAFDGIGDILERVNAANTLSGLPGGSGDRTMFFVTNYANHEGVSAGLVYGDGARNQAFGLVSDWNGGDLAVQGWGNVNDFDSGVDAASAGWLVQSVVLEADAFNQYLDGALIDSGTHAFATDVQRLILGGEIKDLGESSLEVAAAFIYDRALTEPERQDMETYLQTTYVDDNFIFA